MSDPVLSSIEHEAILVQQFKISTYIYIYVPKKNILRQKLYKDGKENKTYCAWMIMDNINGLFVTQMFPQAIRCKNKKRIILLQRMGDNRWSCRQDRHVHRFRKSEFCLYWFSVKFRMFHINIAYRFRNLHKIEANKLQCCKLLQKIVQNFIPKASKSMYVFFFFFAL